MENPRQRVTDLVLRLEAARRAVAEMEQELDSLLLPLQQGPSHPRTTPPTPSVSPVVARRMFVTKGTVVPGSLPARLLERMRADNGRVFKLEDFRDLQGNGKPQKISIALGRLNAAGHLEKLKLKGRRCGYKIVRRAEDSATASDGHAVRVRRVRLVDQKGVTED